MIEVKNLCKKYGSNYAIKDVSFKIESGQIVGFLGPNGAGKTTTLNILTGYVAQSSGDVFINGIDIKEDPISAKKYIGYLPDTPPLYQDLTVLEYLNFVYELKGFPKKNKKIEVNRVMEKVKITDMQKRLTKNLSKGYRQRVGLAQAMLGNPEILILDEPTIGLDPKQIIEMRQLIKGLSKTHTILFSSHILSEVSAICDKVMIINNGKLIDTTTTDSLKGSLTGTDHITIRVKGSYDAVKTAFKDVSKIKSIKNVGSLENGTIDVEILSADKDDIREIVYNTVKKNNISLLSLKSKAYSLEEIFLNITNQGDGKSIGTDVIEMEDKNSNE